MARTKRTTSRRSSEKSGSVLDGLWRVEGVFGWAGLERPETPTLWWFGEGLHLKPGPGLRRTGAGCPFEATGARREGRLVITCRLGRPSHFLFRLKGDELRLFGSGDASSIVVRRGQTPSYLLRRVPGGALVAPHERPRTIEDPVLGTLRQLRSLPGSYQGTVTVGDRKVGVGLRPRDLSNEEILRRARRVHSALARHVSRATAFATRQLLDLCHDWRQQAGQKAVTSRDFRQALLLLDLSFDDEGVTFEFDDGGLFRGHRIKAVMGPDDRFVNADI